MLSLYFLFSGLIKFLFMWLYLVTKQISTLIFFYPVGITLSILILFWLFYTSIICLKIILYNIKILKYYLNPNDFIQNYTQILFYKNFYFLGLILSNLIFFLSEYLFVFSLKRFELYFLFFFCLLVFLL